ncbi:MAG: hypothetical protein C0428_12225 [Polaromonas sp.]|nr:hypothetical protein [Polaromonas sp.]
MDPFFLLKTYREDNMLKILIAVDGSEHANRAIEAVAHMARSALELEATLVNVSPEPIIYGGYSAATVERFEEDQKKQQAEILTRATAHARAQGLRLGESALGHGVVALELVRIARERQVDQIAIGTRGLGSINSVLMGSVSQRLIHESPVPVLLVR